MPWKCCPFCGGFSYSAATRYDSWSCPYCNKDITSSPEIWPQQPKQAQIHGCRNSAS